MFEQATTNLKRLPITWAMLALCSFCFVLTWQGWVSTERFIFFESVNARHVLHQPWRLLSPAVLHHDWLHLLTNLLVWYEFARQVEHKQGSIWLLLLASALALATNMIEYAMVDNRFGGLSGVVLGLAGYVGVLSLINRSRDWYFPAMYWLAILGVLLYDILSATGLFSAQAGFTQHAVYVHGAGFVFGALLGLLSFMRAADLPPNHD